MVGNTEVSYMTWKKISILFIIWMFEVKKIISFEKKIHIHIHISISQGLKLSETIM